MGCINIDSAVSQPFEVPLQGCVCTPSSPASAPELFARLALDHKDLDSCNDGQRDYMGIIRLKVFLDLDLLAKDFVSWYQF